MKRPLAWYGHPIHKAHALIVAGAALCAAAMRPLEARHLAGFVLAFLGIAALAYGMYLRVRILRGI